MEVVDDRGNAEPVEHFPGVIRIAVGVDELAPRQPLQRADQPIVSRQPIERNVVHVAHEMMRIDVVVLHQPGKRGAAAVEVHLLDPPRLGRVHAKQALDVRGHPLVDQVEQPASRRIETIVEVEDPVADVGKARVHERAWP